MNETCSDEWPLEPSLTKSVDDCLVSRKRICMGHLCHGPSVIEHLYNAKASRKQGINHVAPRHNSMYQSPSISSETKVYGGADEHDHESHDKITDTDRERAEQETATHKRP